MTNDNRPSLDDLLASVSLDVPPPPRVWHGVVFGVARKMSASRFLALAASVTCVCLAAALVWTVVRGRHDPGRPTTPLTAARASSFDEPADAKYVATRAVLESTFRERLAALDPTTRQQIENSLAVIRHAHEDIAKALAAAPANPLLEQLLESTWHDEIDLYDRVVRSTQPTLART